MFEYGELPQITISLMSQFDDEGVTDVLVLDCDDPITGVSTRISLAHEAMNTLFPIAIAFMLRENTEEDLVEEVRKVAAEHVEEDT